MPSKNLVSVEVLAEFFGKDVRTIQLWAKNEGLPKEERGKYDFIPCVQWYISKLEKEIERLKLGDETVYELERQNKKLSIQKKQMEISQLEKTLISLPEIEELLVDMATVFASGLQTLKSKLAPKLVGLEDMKTIQNIIEEETNNLRQKIGTMENNIRKKNELPNN